MSDISTTAPSTKLVRPVDLALGVLVGVVYAGLWALLPAEWLEVHVGGKPFLLLFVVLMAVTAGFLSRTLLVRDVAIQETPALLMAVQLLFWNPIAFRAVYAAAEAAGMVGLFPWGAALAGLVALGLPTSLFGAFFCGDKWWIAAYVTRALQCFFAPWVPMIPGVVFLHMLMIAQVITGGQYGTKQRVAFSLVLAEQVLAFLWAFLYCRFE